MILPTGEVYYIYICIYIYIYICVCVLDGSTTLHRNPTARSDPLVHVFREHVLDV